MPSYVTVQRLHVCLSDELGSRPNSAVALRKPITWKNKWLTGTSFTWQLVLQCDFDIFSHTHTRLLRPDHLQISYAFLKYTVISRPQTVIIYVLQSFPANGFTHYLMISTLYDDKWQVKFYISKMNWCPALNWWLVQGIPCCCLMSAQIDSSAPRPFVR